MDVPTYNSESGKSGLGHWARRVLKECDRATKQFDPDSIHDLRVALRQCLSIAEGVSEFDPHPGWKRLKHSAKQLLKHLGQLRDAHVLLDWVGRLDLSATEQGKALKNLLEQEESSYHAEAVRALASLDHKKWKSLAKQLRPRADSIEPDGLPAQYLALRRWEKAFHRHRFALRSRSRISFHRLRIAIKDFRYSLENFVPAHHSSWAQDLKSLQDALGERHDLDVLWSKILRLATLDESTKTEWKARIAAEQKQCLGQYLSKTKGTNSFWTAWRAALPRDKRLEQATVSALDVWSSFRTPNINRAHRVTALAVELYDLLAARGFAGGLPSDCPRTILEAAALLQDVGRFDGNKGHHKRTYRMIRRLPLPADWEPSDLRLTALVARYHRKALPQLKHKEFRALSFAYRQATLFLAGILRFANCFVQPPQGTVRRFSLDLTHEGMVIQVYGVAADEPFLLKLASAKHLLEIACRRSILIIPGSQGAPLRQPVPVVSTSPAKVSSAGARRTGA
jgi:CHAD domain-containing protein